MLISPSERAAAKASASRGPSSSVAVAPTTVLVSSAARVVWSMARTLMFCMTTSEA